MYNKHILANYVPLPPLDHNFKNHNKKGGIKTYTLLPCSFFKAASCFCFSGTCCIKVSVKVVTDREAIDSWETPTDYKQVSDAVRIVSDNQFIMTNV